MKTNATEDWMAVLLKGDGLAPFEQEYRFHATRKWRFDFAWPDIKLAVEIEGGVYTQGRHTRGKGYEGDLEKYNEAAIDGWTVLRFSTNQIKRGPSAVLDTIRRAMDRKETE